MYYYNRYYKPCDWALPFKGSPKSIAAPPKVDKQIKIGGAFNDGALRWTYPPTAPPQKLSNIKYTLIYLFTFCSHCYMVLKRCPNTPEKFKQYV